MSENISLTRARLKTPKAAAIAGNRLFRPSDYDILAASALRAGRSARSRDVVRYGIQNGFTCIDLVPFAGVAFLWFIGVLRDRLGQQEERFFATVFFAVPYCFWPCCSRQLR